MCVLFNIYFFVSAKVANAQKGAYLFTLHQMGMVFIIFFLNFS